MLDTDATAAYEQGIFEEPKESDLYFALTRIRDK